VFGVRGVTKGRWNVNCVVFGMMVKLLRVRVVTEVEVLTEVVHVGVLDRLPLTPEMMLVILVKNLQTPVKVKTTESPATKSVSGFILKI
jgi:hypothetical protein